MAEETPAHIQVTRNVSNAIKGNDKLAGWDFYAIQQGGRVTGFEASYNPPALASGEYTGLPQELSRIIETEMKNGGFNYLENFKVRAPEIVGAQR